MKCIDCCYMAKYLKIRIKNISRCDQRREVREEAVLRMVREWSLPSNEAEKIRLFLADPDCMN
ncbi:MAG: hypothetical protein P9X27_02570 [Candidatus Kaelpia aquatica]|nr:hypothetical protein [Candidatus Kaelpia aquatica]